MGKSNRQRRAEKHRRRERAARQPRTDERAPLVGSRDLAEFLVLEAAEAADHGESERLEGILGQLGELDGVAGPALTGCLVDGLRCAWEAGWEPADVVRAATKRLDATHGELAAEMISLEAATGSGSRIGMPERWAAQLGQLERHVRSDEQRWSEPGALRRGVALLGLAMNCPCYLISFRHHRGGVGIARRPGVRFGAWMAGCWRRCGAC